MSASLLTASQTVGPFFGPCMLREGASRNVLLEPGTPGERIRIEGRVLDGDGAPVPDALVEIWQADAAGHYNHPADPQPGTDFTGYGRSGTNEDGGYWFETIKPGPVPFDGQQMQAPHVVVTVFSRGLLNHLVTRLYFADESASDSDPILAYVPAERRSTLLAQRQTKGTIAIYRFDIIMQGAGETVFFNL